MAQQLNSNHKVVDDVIFSIVIFSIFTLNIAASIGLKGCAVRIQTNKKFHSAPEFDS